MCSHLGLSFSVQCRGKARYCILIHFLFLFQCLPHNPVEKFWAWLRRHLRALDLQDAVAKRPVLGKTAYRERVRRVLHTKKATRVARNCTLGLAKVCREVLRKTGAATRG